MAGLAWLATAALTGYLAYQQWTLSQQLAALGISDEGLGGYAALNAISAAVTLFFGARLLTKPTRRLLDASAAWAILSVLGGMAQIGAGAGNDVFAFGTIAAAVAGVMSFVGRQSMPQARQASAAVPGWLTSAVQPQGAPSTTQAASPSIAPRIQTAERVVVVLIVVAALAGAALLLTQQREQPAGIGSNAATPAPTVRPTTQPAVTAAPIYVAGSGIITFGTSYDPDTLYITKPISRFKATYPEIAWSAELTRPVGANSLSWVLASQSASGTERVIL